MYSNFLLTYYSSLYVLNGNVFCKIKYFSYISVILEFFINTLNYVLFV